MLVLCVVWPLLRDRPAGWIQAKRGRASFEEGDIRLEDGWGLAKCV